MALTLAQQQKVRAALHRAYSAQELPLPWTKAEVDAAISEADTWIDSNQASFASSLSAAFAGSSSAADKSVLFIATLIAQRLVSQPEHVSVLLTVLNQLQDIQGA